MKYTNAKIYKIINDTTNKIYIGSTTVKYLSDRMAKHRNHRKRYLLGKRSYITSFEIVQDPSSSIVLIENFPCEDINELHKRERYWIENSANCVNKNLPFRTEKEYREKNKAKDKGWYIKNANKYTCDKCNFGTPCLTNYKAHLTRKKHLDNCSQ